MMNTDDFYFPARVGCAPVDRRTLAKRISCAMLSGHFTGNSNNRRSARPGSGHGYADFLGKDRLSALSDDRCTEHGNEAG